MFVCKNFKTAYKCRGSYVMSAWTLYIKSTTTLTHIFDKSLKSEKIFLPGHNKVSSLKEPTVSRDDSIVVALPSNILPENNKNK